MPKLRYDLNEITSFRVEPGKYRARLVKCEQGLSKMKKPMLTWTWKIISGAEKGKEVRSWTSLQENALGGLKEHLEALGLKGKVNTDTNRLVGRIVILVVGTEIRIDNNGVEAERNTVKLYRDKSAEADDEEEVEEEDAEESEDEDSEDEDEDDEDSDEDEEDEDEDEDEEEMEEPRRRPASKKPAPKPVAKKKAAPVAKSGKKGLPF